MSVQGITTIARPFNAIERIERLPLTWYQGKIFIAIGLAWLFDCIDIGMMTYALAPIKSYFRLNTTQAGLLGSMSFAGMFFGAALSGVLGDKYGRKRIFQLSIFIWGIASFLCASSAGFEQLLVFRFLLGIGMGMEFPVGQSLICELAPTKYRGRSIAGLAGFIPVGAVSCGILACFVLHISDWRGLFLIQGILAIGALALRRLIPESPRWLEKTGQIEEANVVLTAMENGVLKELGGKSLPEPQVIEIESELKPVINSVRHSLRTVWSSIYAKRTFMLWSIWFLILMGYHGTRVWLAGLLHAKGYSIMESTNYVLLITLAGIPGFITAFWLVEKWGRKKTLVATLLGMAAAFCLYAGAGNLTQIIIYGLIMQFFMFAMWCPLYVYTPELYATSVRATGSGCASALGRIGATLGPVLIGMALVNCGQSIVFVMAAAAFIIAAAMVFILGEETKGRLLESISPQL